MTTKRTYYKHLHIHEVATYVPSVTFRIDRDGDEIKVSWAICSAKDNFCRKTGRNIADKNMEDGLYVTGERRIAAPLIADILDALIFGELNTGNTKKSNPSFYRNQVIHAVEECHMAEAFHESVDAEDSLWAQTILPWLFKTNFFFNSIPFPR